MKTKPLQAGQTYYTVQTADWPPDKPKYQPVLFVVSLDTVTAKRAYCTMSPRHTVITTHLRMSHDWQKKLDYTSHAVIAALSVSPAVAWEAYIARLIVANSESWRHLYQRQFLLHEACNQFRTIEKQPLLPALPDLSESKNLLMDGVNRFAGLLANKAPKNSHWHQAVEEVYQKLQAAVVCEQARRAKELS